jgi:hypothetical protein
MKGIIFIFSLLFGLTACSQDLYPFNLSKSEKKFVNNVIHIHGTPPVEITKRDDNHIVIEFDDTMVVLKPDGYVGEVWVLDDGDWLSLGTEKDAY